MFLGISLTVIFLGPNKEQLCRQPLELHPFKEPTLVLERMG